MIILHDIKYAFRQLIKRPAFTMTAAAILALGIGANTALFSVIYQVLLSPLPFTSPERIAILDSVWTDSGNHNAVSGPDYLDWAGQQTAFEEFGAFSMSRTCLTGRGDPVSLKSFYVTSSFMRLFPEKIALGQRDWPRERTANDPNVAVLSYRLWQERYQADPNVIGQVMILDDKPHTIVAVTGPLMGFIEDMVDVFIPFWAESLTAYPRNVHYLTVLGRLKPTTSFAQAQGRMTQLSALIEQEHPQSNFNKRAAVKPLHESIVSRVRVAFYVLYGAVSFLLLIACMNVSNLLVARAKTRHQEIALRRALGARQWRLLCQLLTESLLLGLLAGLLGLLLAQGGLELLRWVAPAGIPGMDEIGLNLPVLGFTLVLALGTSILCGLLPAWHSTSFDMFATLKNTGSRVSSNYKRRRSLSFLVVSQISLALILLTGAGLLIKSFSKLQSAHPGFSSEQVLAVNLVRPGSEKNRDDNVRKRFFREVTDRLGTLPGVTACATVDIPPMKNYGNTAGLRMDGHDDNLTTEVRVITPDYFTCLDIPLLRGRTLHAHEGDDGLHAAVVNEAFVQRYLQGQNPLGLTFHCWDQTHTIVGVVGNVKLKSLRQQGFAPMAYLPMTQHCGWDMTVLLRSETDPLNLAQSARQVIWDIDPDQPVMNISTLHQIVRQSYGVERFCTILLTLMAGVALIMAMAGLYGMMSFAVNERHHEIGVRMALGAGYRDLLILVAGKALILTLIGMALGLTGAWAVSRYMGSMLFQIDSHDLATFVLVSLLLFAISILACLIPARRAAKVDPMEALRYE